MFNFIPRQTEESVFDDVGFARGVRSSLMPCLPAMVIRSGSKSSGASLSNFRFFSLSRYIERLVVGIVCASIAIYSYLKEQNCCTELSMRLPKVMKEIEALQQENTDLCYQIIRFESPDHLLQLASCQEYAHLKFPSLAQILTIKEGLAVQWPQSGESLNPSQGKNGIVLGAR